MNRLLSGNALLALSAAMVWGGSDFAGGMGVKQAGGGMRAGLRIVLLSHASSFFVLLLIGHLRGDVAPHGWLLAWGLGAGVVGGLAITSFYIALSRGAMGASAAVSGLLAAAIPAVVSMVQDGSPGVRPLIGFVVAGIAIWMIAVGPGEDSATTSVDKAERETMALAMLAGVGFGLYFVALKMAGPAGLIWPMATARIGSISVCLLMFLGLQMRSSKTETAQDSFGCRAVGWSLATAVLDTSGNLMFIAATRAGRLDVAAVLASLYPAGTILLAALALGERPTQRQAIGMATAAVAVVLIAM